MGYQQDLEIPTVNIDEITPQSIVTIAEQLGWTIMHDIGYCNPYGKQCCPAMVLALKCGHESFADDDIDDPEIDIPKILSNTTRLPSDFIEGIAYGFDWPLQNLDSPSFLRSKDKPITSNFRRGFSLGQDVYELIAEEAL